MKEIEIYGDYIQLDQFLKKENIILKNGLNLKKKLLKMDLEMLIF